MNSATLQARRRLAVSRAWRRAGLQETRFLAGRQGFPFELGYVVRLGFELITHSRRLASLGPSILVLGRAPEGWSWRESLALAREIGVWSAAQGFAVLTLGEAGLAEAVATSCERAGGRATRCLLGAQHRSTRALAFTSELARRITLAKLARATLALSPTGEAPGMLGFLSALSRFERLPSRPILLACAAQWEFSGESYASPGAATQPIETLEDLARALELG